MNYKPYSAEWHRKRYLKEAIDKYMDDYVDTETIVKDILDIVFTRSEEAYREFERSNELAYRFRMNANKQLPITLHNLPVNRVDK